jgi:hypothetical protein
MQAAYHGGGTELKNSSYQGEILQIGFLPAWRDSDTRQWTKVQDFKLTSQARQ